MTTTPEHRELLDGLRAAAEAVRGVDRAVPLLRYEARLGRARHLGDLVRPAPEAGWEPASPPEAAGVPGVPDVPGVPGAARRVRPPAEAYGGDPVPVGDGPATLQEALRMAADLAPDKGTRYIRADGSEDFQSYRRLRADAQRLLGGLRRTGLRPGDAVLFQIGGNRAFVTAFWACVLGGFLPTPVGPAPGYEQDNAVTQKLRNAWELLGRPLILTDERLAGGVAKLPALWGEDGVRTASVEELGEGGEDAEWHPATPGTPVVHLLTSGSTGTPKCVRHSSESILARTRATAAANGFGEHEVSLNWMPLDHVGGIVMYNVRDVVLRCEHVNAETEAFLAEPTRWLDWAHRHRVTNTWAPNFAFALVNQRAEAVRSGSWDLSALRHICNAGEAVVARTAERFMELLAPHGLPADAMRPCWGMSETSSGVTYSTLPRDDPEAGRLWADQDTLAGELRLVGPGTPGAVGFTEVGPPIPGVRLRIVDHDDRTLPEDVVGRLQITGPTITTGYHRNDAANAESFTADGWFNTGDLAFLHEGRLTITGREKDLIIVRGANYLNYDIESVAEQVPGTEATYVAACARPGPDTDELVVFFVPASDDPVEVRTTIAGITVRLAEEIGLRPDLVLPVARERFPKTASGKIQRSRLLTDLDQGAFDDWLREQEIAEESEATLPAWFFDRVWIETAAPSPGAAPEGPWLVLDACGLADRLRDRPGVPELITLAPGEDPAPVVAAHAFGAVLHGWGLGDADLETGPLSVVRLIQDLAAHGRTPPTLVLTTRGLWTGPGDRVDPLKATLPGLVRTAAAEDVLPLVRQVDLPAGTPGEWAAAVVAELGRRDGEGQAAYRDGRRLVARLRPVSFGEADERLVPGGRYLLTGGLGGIAYELAQYLLAAYGARLLLVGRTEVDPDGAGERAERLADLRSLGDVAYRAADVADEDALRAAVEEAERRWGAPLDGILHLAGAGVSAQCDDPEEHTLTRESPRAFLDAYRPKVLGTLAIAGLLRDRPDTPLVLFSSVNGDFGGRSFAAYSSANSFLNGFAEHWGHELGRPVRCLAWSMWTGVGMNRGNPADAAASRGFRPIGPARGLASFLAALSLDRVHLLIGLDGRNEHIVRAMVPGELRGAEIVVAYTGSAEAPQVRGALAAHAAALPMPVRCQRVERIPVRAGGEVDREWLLADAMAGLARGGRPYVAPVTELERVLAELWREVLGGGEIGRDDRFFDLGGSSVRAAQLVVRINDTVPVRMSVHQLYEHPTVGELAAVLERA
ncbi:SDR family NAD(P)-dependent oxidoreductase [Microbispora siamensis]